MRVFFGMGGGFRAWKGSTSRDALKPAIPHRPEFPAQREIAWNAKQGHAAPVASPWRIFRGRATTCRPREHSRPRRRELARVGSKSRRPPHHVSGRRQRGPDGQRVPITNTPLAAAEVDYTWQSLRRAGRHHVRPPLRIRIRIEKPLRPAGNNSSSRTAFLLTGRADPRCEYTARLHRGPGGYAAAARQQSPRQVGLLLQRGRHPRKFNTCRLLGTRGHAHSPQGAARPRRLRALGSHFQFCARQVSRSARASSHRVPLGKLAAGSTSGRKRRGGPLRCGLHENRTEQRKTGEIREIAIHKSSGHDAPPGHTVCSCRRSSRKGAQLRSRSRRQPHAGPVEGTLRCDIRSLGQSLARTRPMSLGAPAQSGGGASSTRSPRPAPSRPFIEAVFQWTDAAFTSKPGRIGTCACPTFPARPSAAKASWARGSNSTLPARPQYLDSGTARCDLAPARREVEGERSVNTIEPRKAGSMILRRHEHAAGQTASACMDVVLWSSWSARTRRKASSNIAVGAPGRAPLQGQYQALGESGTNQPSSSVRPAELYAQLLTHAYAAVKGMIPTRWLLGLLDCRHRTESSRT